MKNTYTTIIDGVHTMKKTLLLDKIQSRLKKNGLKFETTSDIIHFNIEIDNIVGKVAVFIQASENTILSYAVINNKIPKEQYNSVSEYLHLANYGLLYGNFEMDFNDGEIRYKLAIDCQDVANIPNNYIDRSVLIPCQMIQKYGKGIIQLMLGIGDPKFLIEEAEQNNN